VRLARLRQAGWVPAGEVTAAMDEAAAAVGRTLGFCSGPHGGGRVTLGWLAHSEPEPAGDPLLRRRVLPPLATQTLAVVLASVAAQDGQEEPDLEQLQPSTWVATKTVMETIRRLGLAEAQATAALRSLLPASGLLATDGELVTLGPGLWAMGAAQRQGLQRLTTLMVSALQRAASSDDAADPPPGAHSDNAGGGPHEPAGA
jgi:hypothetical protein